MRKWCSVTSELNLSVFSTPQFIASAHKINLQNDKIASRWNLATASLHSVNGDVKSTNIGITST